MVDRLDKWNDASLASDKTRKAAVLFALTSFEFFDVLAEASGSVDDAAHLVLTLVKSEFST